MVARHHIFAPFLISYDPDGAMVYRKRDGVEGGLGFQRIEEYAWNAFKLLEQFTVRTDAVAEGGGPGCEPDATTMPADVWRYRFNPMQEREQKRQEITSGNVVRDGLAWTYTLLGADTKQLATYNGIEGAFCGQPSVWMWPVEYNSYGPANTRVILRPNGTKEYVIADHLGSPRITVNDQGAILQHTTYAPFASVLTTTGTGQRTGYIGREADNETGLGNYGVHLYEPEYGRFMSVDVLWGEYEGWQPYQYGANQPTLMVDDNGREIFPKNLSDEQVSHLGKLLDRARAIGSPTINRVLEAALGNESAIHFYLLENPGTDAVFSDISQLVNLQHEFNVRWYSNAITVSSVQPCDMLADIVFEKDLFNTSMDGEETDATLVLIDELFHAVSTIYTSESRNELNSDHKLLYSLLSKEYEAGLLILTPAEKVVLQVKIQDYGTEIKEGAGK
ncbi:MAG: RHS repeat-associated core domain-containing protein [Candidatus Kapaibacterium sp.]|nr:MAG: RHS repeat-associated core domain-containing protein [Candidatus Kapabacteria bacterium]